MRDLRREKLEKEQAAAEAEFRAKLLELLKVCAAGSWGLFGQNEHLDLPGGLSERQYENSGAKALIELGQEIADIRTRLGITESFALFVKLIEFRGRHSSNDVGEARLAQAWLQELGK